MAEDWTAIAGEVDAAISEVGFLATLIRRTPGPGPAWDTSTYATAEYPITVIDDRIMQRDAAGTLTGEVRRVLTMSALGATTPRKDDRVQVRGTVHRVLDVMPLAPGGVDLLFDVEIGGPDGPAT